MTGQHDPRSMEESMEVVIREFEEADYDEAVALWKRTPGMGISAADSRERIGAFLQCNPGLCFAARRPVGAGSAGELVGTILCGSDTRRGYIYHLAVDASMQRQGLGTRLVEAALAALRLQGVDKCHLMVLSGNELGAAFWRGRGWTLREDILLFSKNC
jgi:N-acetylglutamate synthase